MNIDRHGPRRMPDNCKNLNPPYFSLPSTFKPMFLFTFSCSLPLSNAHSLSLSSSRAPFSYLDLFLFPILPYFLSALPIFSFLSAFPLFPSSLLSTFSSIQSSSLPSSSPPIPLPPPPLSCPFYILPCLPFCLSPSPPFIFSFFPYSFPVLVSLPSSSPP